MVINASKLRTLKSDHKSRLFVFRRNGGDKNIPVDLTQRSSNYSQWKNPPSKEKPKAGRRFMTPKSFNLFVDNEGEEKVSQGFHNFSSSNCIIINPIFPFLYSKVSQTLSCNILSFSAVFVLCGRPECDEFYTFFSCRHTHTFFLSLWPCGYTACVFLGRLIHLAYCMLVWMQFICPLHQITVYTFLFLFFFFF